MRGADDDGVGAEQLAAVADPPERPGMLRTAVAGAAAAAAAPLLPLPDREAPDSPMVPLPSSSRLLRRLHAGGPSAASAISPLLQQRMLQASAAAPRPRPPKARGPRSRAADAIAVWLACRL